MSNAAKRHRSKAMAAGSISVAAAVTAALASAAPAMADTNQHVTLNGTQPDWATSSADKGSVPAAQTITTRVYLQGQDPAGLAAAARAVTDPGSPAYHRYLTPAQIQARFGATADQISQVTTWLKSNGLNVQDIATGWIDASGPASKIQSAFGTQLNEFALADGKLHYAPKSDAQLPASLARVVAGVSGLSDQAVTNHVDSVKKNDVVNGPTPVCSNYWDQHETTQFPPAPSGSSIPIDTCGYDPQQLRDAYGVTASGMTGQGATIAVIDWGGSSTMLADANQYSTNHGDKPFAAGQYNEVMLPGASQAVCGSATGEESLDIDMAHGLAPDAKVLYIGAASCFDNDLMAAEAYVVDNHAADVVSNSWGGLMHTTDQGDEDPGTMAAYNAIFQKGALEDIGFDFSTGDCGDENPANRPGDSNCAPDSARKQTDWPDSSAWVTAVGGTTLGIDQNDHASFEYPMGDNASVARATASSWPKQTFYFGGGGGTSEDVAQPWYQTGVVPSSLSGTLMSGAPAAQPMRTVPDVAMNGSLATAVLVGQTLPDPNDPKAPPFYQEGAYGGTSVSAPEFSALQADAKQANGGTAIGFANPGIYSLAGSSAFHDVTEPSSPVDTVYEGMISNPDGTTSFGGRLLDVGHDSSLVATPGYDDATGVGSPNADYIAKIGAAVAAAPTGPAVQRISGPDRYATGIAVSKTEFPGANSAPAVILATGATFPDALSGVPLAKKLGAPLLLTPSATPDARVTAEVHRVLQNGGVVYVLGGTQAVSPAVIAALGLPSDQIQRIAGNDRFGTSLAIADQLGDPSHVVLATGNGFADALAAGPYAADVFGDGTPAAILLTNDTVLPTGVKQYLTHATAVAAVGGQAVTAAGNAPNVVAKFKGIDRFDTASQVAAKFSGEHTAGLAVGSQFADALTGAAYLANTGGPLVLTNTNDIPGATLTALQTISTSLGTIGNVEIFGGPLAVSDNVEQQVATAVHGHVVPSAG